MSSVETSRAAIIRRMAREGWMLERHGASHDIYVHSEKDGVISVPRHRTVSPGVARAIARAAGWL